MGIFANNKEEPLISIIIPSYNHQLYIGKAIESVLLQTYKNLEIIIIDDGSKDDSINVISRYNDSRIKFIKQENQGAHNAINNGIMLAKGDYIAILNSDDLYEEKRFSIMLKEMRNADAEFACSYINVIDSTGKVLGEKKGWNNMEPWMIEHPEKSFKVSDDFKYNLIINNFTSTTSNFLFSRKLYEKIGGMRNLRFVHDWDFALRAAEVSKCIIVRKPLMEYRIHDSNTISKNRNWMLFEIAWIWASNLKRFYKDSIFCDTSDGLIKLIESINLQGNDKIFWIIKSFIEIELEKGTKNPEEILLDNSKIREKLLDYVVE